MAFKGTKSNALIEDVNTDTSAKTFFENQIEQLWDVEDVASFLKVSTQSIYRWADDGTIPCHKLGKRVVRFSPSEIARWIQNQKESNNGNRN